MKDASIISISQIGFHGCSHTYTVPHFNELMTPQVAPTTDRKWPITTSEASGGEKNAGRLSVDQWGDSRHSSPVWFTGQSVCVCVCYTDWI